MTLMMGRSRLVEVEQAQALRRVVPFDCAQDRRRAHHSAQDKAAGSDEARNPRVSKPQRSVST